MNKSIGKQLIGNYLLIIVLILLATGAILSVSLKQYYLDNVKNNLERESRLAASMIEDYLQTNGGDEEQLGQISRIVSDNIGARVTIVDKSGKVVADSVYLVDELGPHGGRPEIYQALQGETGISTRFSDTEGQQMLYVAMAFDKGDAQGVVRLARSMEEVEAVHYQVLLLILLAIILIGVIAFMFSTRLAVNFSRPISELTAAVGEIAKGNLNKRISYWSDDELGQLASAVNDMASKMDKTLTDISAVNDQLELVLNHTVNGIFMVDLDAKISYANPKAVKLLDLGDDYQEQIDFFYARCLGIHKIAQQIYKVIVFLFIFQFFCCHLHRKLDLGKIFFHTKINKPFHRQKIIFIDMLQNTMGYSILASKIHQQIQAFILMTPT